DSTVPVVGCPRAAAAANAAASAVVAGKTNVFSFMVCCVRISARRQRLCTSRSTLRCVLWTEFRAHPRDDRLMIAFIARRWPPAKRLSGRTGGRRGAAEQRDPSQAPFANDWEIGTAVRPTLPSARRGDADERRPSGT